MLHCEWPRWLHQATSHCCFRWCDSLLEGSYLAFLAHRSSATRHHLIYLVFHWSFADSNISPFQAHGYRCVGQLCTLWQDWGTGGAEPEPDRSGLWEMQTFASHSVGGTNIQWYHHLTVVIDVRWCNWYSINFNHGFKSLSPFAIQQFFGVSDSWECRPEFPGFHEFLGVFQMQSRTLLWCCTWQKTLKIKTKDADGLFQKSHHLNLNVIGIGILQIALYSWLTSYGIPVVADTIPSPEAPHVSEQIGCHTKRHAASSRLQCRVAQDRDDSYGKYIYIYVYIYKYA